MSNTGAARHAREAAQLLDLSAPEARERVAAMDSAELLDRAEEAERRLGKGRTTVLRAIDQRRAELDEGS